MAETEAIKGKIYKCPNCGSDLRFDPKTNKFSSCEALLRLRNPQMGFISPAVFMPVAERNGMVVSIDSFVLDEVCEMLNVSSNTLWRWNRTQYLCSVKIGRTPMYKLSDVNNLREGRRGA